MKFHRLWAAASATVLLSVPAIAANGINNWPVAPFWTPAPVEVERPSARGALATTAAVSPLPFVAVAPCRIVDTRGGAPLGAEGFMTASTPRAYVLQGQCGIPADAVAVSLNITVVNTAGPGYVSAWPVGQAQPVVSTLNYVAGDVLANAAIVPLGPSGDANFACMNSGCDMVVDTNGYFSAQGVVTAVNGVSGGVTLAPGANIAITPTGSTFTIDATVPQGPPGPQGDPGPQGPPGPPGASGNANVFAGTGQIPGETANAVIVCNPHIVPGSSIVVATYTTGQTPAVPLTVTGTSSGDGNCAGGPYFSIKGDPNGVSTKPFSYVIFNP